MRPLGHIVGMKFIILESLMQSAVAVGLGVGTHSLDSRQGWQFIGAVPLSNSYLCHLSAFKLLRVSLYFVIPGLQYPATFKLVK
jgi:hypothetical protein